MSRFLFEVASGVAICVAFLRSIAMVSRRCLLGAAESTLSECDVDAAVSTDSLCRCPTAILPNLRVWTLVSCGCSPDDTRSDRVPLARSPRHRDLTGVVVGPKPAATCNVCVSNSPKASDTRCLGCEGPSHLPLGVRVEMLRTRRSTEVALPGAAERAASRNLAIRAAKRSPPVHDLRDGWE